MPEILVVVADDDDLVLSHMQRLLGSFPQVRVVGLARDGHEAVSLVDRLRPDLVFVDVEMPGLTGLQVLKAITHRPIAVVMTAYSRYRQMAFETDAIECLMKPVDLEQMRRTMGKIEGLIEAGARIKRSGRGA